MHPDHVAMKDEAVQDFKFVVHKRVQNEVSSKGFIYGYGGGVVMLLVSGLILLASGALASDAKPHVIVNGYKYVCLVTGIWWLVGTLACTAYMHPRPGPPLPFKTPEEDLVLRACGRMDRAHQPVEHGLDSIGVEGGGHLPDFGQEPILVFLRRIEVFRSQSLVPAMRQCRQGFGLIRDVTLQPRHLSGCEVSQ